jgi:hypothetical protein
MIYEPVEQRYRKDKNVHHVFAGSTAAAITIGAGALAAGGAVAGGIMSSQAAGKRAKASERAAQQFQQQSQQAVSEFKQQSQADLQQLDRALAAANIATPGQLIQNMEQFTPGSAEQRRAAGQFIQELLSPEITAGERRQLRKETAEAFGGGYRIPVGPTPFESIAQNQYTANMDQLIRQRRMQGTSLAFDWNNLAQQFMSRAANINVSAATIPYEARAAVTTGAANLATGQAAEYYKAQENAAEAQYQANMVPAQTVTAATGALAGGLGNAGMGMMLGGGGLGSSAGAGAGGGFGGFFGRTVSSPSEYASGLRGTGLAGSFQNLMMGQLGSTPAGMVYRGR